MTHPAPRPRDVNIEYLGEILCGLYGTAPLRKLRAWLRSPVTNPMEITADDLVTDFHPLTDRQLAELVEQVSKR